MFRKAFFVGSLLAIMGISLEAHDFLQKEDSLKIEAQIALNENNRDLQLKAYLGLVNLYETEGMLAKHDSVLALLLQQSIAFGDLDMELEAYNRMGISQYTKGDNEGAIKYFKKTLEINYSRNDSSAISNMMENIGMIFQYMSVYDSAMTYYVNSIRIREKLNHHRLFDSYCDMSTLYEKMGDTINQRKYLLKAREIINTYTEPIYNNLAIWHNSWGDYLAVMGQKDSLEYYYTKTWEYSAAIGWKQGMATAAGNLAQVYIDRGEYQRALAEHLRALQLSKEMDYVFGIIEQYNFIAGLYRTMRNNSMSVIYADSALQQSRTHGYSGLQLTALNELFLNSRELNDFRSALDYHVEYTRLNDSIFAVERQSRIAELETEYETEKKDQQILLLAAENQIKTQQMQLGIVVLALLLISSFAAYIYFSVQKRNAKFVELALQHRLSRAQLNPHFLSNALSSIQRYIYDQKTDTAIQYLGKFSQLNRSVLEHTLVESISLTDEIEMLTNYLEFEQIRLGNKFEFQIITGTDIEADLMYIPPLFIQPFLENAVKHGIQNLEEKGLITVEFSDQKDKIKIEITDNGKGINDKLPLMERKAKTSRSLQIIRKRIDLLQKKHSKLPDFKINSSTDGKGTQVTLYLPIL
jgi:tetratricopeptide (TPR) repeat protein